MNKHSPQPPKNRYADVPRAADWTIEQNWRSYSAQEHDRWNRLFARQTKLLPGRACDEFLDAKARLELSREGIPDFADLSERLAAMTGWRVVAVAGLIPDDAFFEHLANRRFPAGAFIRPETELDYLQEPDVFHDVFGHVPLLANPVYAHFLEAYGKAGRRALGRGQLHNLARLYWYTVEFGLMRTDAGNADLWGRHHVVSRGNGLFAGRQLAQSSAVRSATGDADKIYHQRFPADLFRDRELRTTPQRTASRISSRYTKICGRRRTLRRTSSPRKIASSRKAIFTIFAPKGCGELQSRAPRDALFDRPENRTSVGVQHFDADLIPRL